MAYQSNIPNRDDNVSESQADLLENFTELNTQFAVNHVSFDSGDGDEGKHKFVTYVQQDDDPESSTDEYLIYAKDDAGEPELFCRPQENGTAFQMTKNGGLFYGARPVAFVNFEADETIISQFNVSSVSNVSGARYLITFTNQIVDDAGSPTADYFWDIQAMATSNVAINCRPFSSSSYADSIKPTSIEIVFKDRNGIDITTLLRGTVIIWSQP